MNAIARAEDYAPPSGALAGWRTRALVAGIAGLVVAAVGFFFDRTHFFQAYLIAFVFWATIALGCLGLMMLHHLTRGAWGVVIRRPLEAAAATIPLLGLLFVPILFGLGDLYHWADADAVAHDLVLTAKAPYLDTTFYVVRNVLYFALWSLFALRIVALSRRQDRTGDPALFRRLQAWSAPGFLLLALTLTFASVDWLMSLDPHWFSSVYGLWFFAGTGLSGLTFVVLVANWLARRPPMDAVLEPRHFHDYGKLLLAFVMLWAYLSVSQLILIWAGNLPEEIPYYIRRLEGPWSAMSVLILVGHFVLPFLLLLSAGLKRRRAMLMRVAGWVLAMRWLDYAWNVMPTLAALHPGEHHPLTGIWIDLAATVGIGGIWLWWFARELEKRPLLPVGDPFLAEALQHD